MNLRILSNPITCGSITSEVIVEQRREFTVRPLNVYVKEWAVKWANKNKPSMAYQLAHLDEHEWFRQKTDKLKEFSEWFFSKTGEQALEDALKKHNPQFDRFALLSGKLSTLQLDWLCHNLKSRLAQNEAKRQRARMYSHTHLVG